MSQQIKKSVKPGVLGCLISLLLVVSFFLPRIKNADSSINAINTVLIIVILCLSVHLVRITSSMFFPHVWKNVGFSVLLIIPIVYLLVIAVQFILSQAVFFETIAFNVFLILISFPMFCCYYFSVLRLFSKENKTLKIMTVIIDIVGVVYCFIRLTDKVFIPLALVGTNDITVISEIYNLISPYFSLCIYSLSFVNFIICAKHFGGTDKRIKTE